MRLHSPQQKKSALLTVSKTQNTVNGIPTTNTITNGTPTRHANIIACCRYPGKGKGTP